MGGVDLAAFLPKRTYSLTALRPHLTIASPVFRFSVRLSLAMMAGSIIAQSLGDSGHGNWILLTIAVVMRAGYGLTKQRRDDRIIGTLVGCLVAVGAVAYLPPARWCRFRDLASASCTASRASIIASPRPARRSWRWFRCISRSRGCRRRFSRASPTR